MENDSIKWLNILNASANDICKISNLLEKYSSASFFMGNEALGEFLKYVSEKLLIISDNIDKATGIITRETVSSATQNSINVLNATLAGIKLSEKNNKNN